MKLSTLILCWAGVALAKKGGDKKGKNSGNDSNDNSNSTSVQSSNSTDSGNGTSSSNSSSSDNNGQLIDQQNGAPCINLDALTNVNAQSVDLAGLNLGLLNLGSVDLQDSLAVAEGILALMNSFCLAQVVDLNAVLGLGIDDEVDMFLELAQLAQLESLGFLNVLGAQNLIESNLLFNGNEDVLNIAGLKREVARIKPTLKRTTARRGIVTKRQCNLASVVTVQNLPLCDNNNENNNNNNDTNSNNNDDSGDNNNNDNNNNNNDDSGDNNNNDNNSNSNDDSGDNNNDDSNSNSNSNDDSGDNNDNSGDSNNQDQNANSCAPDPTPDDGVENNPCFDGEPLSDFTR